jgi:membrane AbrB-like protein
MSIPKPTIRSQLQTLSVALLCGIVLFAVDAPLPFLFGSLGGCLIGAFIGMDLYGFPLLSKISRAILGVAIGTSLSWSLITEIPNYSQTLILIPIYVIVIGALGIFYFHKLMKYDRATAFYSAMPGGLQDMLVFGIEAGANPRSLSLIHATRVVTLVVAAPLILVYGFDQTLNRPLGLPAISLPISELLIMLFVGIAGWQVCERIGMFGATVLGPLLFSAPLALTGILEHRPPEEAILISQFFIGLGIGVYYRGITANEFRKDILAGLGFVFILTVVALLTIWIATRISDLPAAEIFLAFWPAGQAELAVLSLAAGANLGVIVLHHILRIVIVIIGAPILGNKKRDGEKT